MASYDEEKESIFVVSDAQAIGNMRGRKGKHAIKEENVGKRNF